MDLNLKRTAVSKRGTDRACIWDLDTYEIYFDNSEPGRTAPNPQTAYSAVLYDLLLGDPVISRRWNTGGQLYPVIQWCNKHINNCEPKISLET